MTTSAQPVNLSDLTRAELADWFRELGQPRYRADQVFRWIWTHGVRSFDAMTDLPKALRERLSREATLGGVTIERVQRSTDGTRKLLVRLADGERVEAVVIPEERRMTLCISSQVGCALACRFCATGTLGLTRHMTPGEIVEQVHLASELLREDGGASVAGEERPITNIVYMGMGEPLHNEEGALRSLQILTDPEGFGYSPKRITLSTVGMIPAMLRVLDEVPVNLAISLHAPEDSLRGELMPVNRRYGLEELIEACRQVPLRHKGRITFEYALLAGVNDRPQDAERLGRLLRDLPAKVNLIPFNEHPGAPFERPTDAAVEGFREQLQGHGIDTFVRTTRGRDIDAACGQLALRDQTS